MEAPADEVLQREREALVRLATGWSGAPSTTLHWVCRLCGYHNATGDADLPAKCGNCAVRLKVEVSEC